MILLEVCNSHNMNLFIPFNPEIIDRTSELRKKGFEGRRLGPKQMTTDTAVRVTRIVVQDKGSLSAYWAPAAWKLTITTSAT
jgi:hypothetical protein